MHDYKVTPDFSVTENFTPHIQVNMVGSATENDYFCQTCMSRYHPTFSSDSRFSIENIEVQNYSWTKSRNRYYDGISLPKHFKANSQHRQLEWLLCRTFQESPHASQKKLNFFRAYNFAPPQKTAKSEFTHTEGCVPTVLCHDTALTSAR